MDYTLLANLLTLAGVLTLAVLLPAATLNRELELPQLRKVGGLWHWRIGRLGGSFYLRAKRGR